MTMMPEWIKVGQKAKFLIDPYEETFVIVSVWADGYSIRYLDKDQQTYDIDHRYRFDKVIPVYDPIDLLIQEVIETH